MFFWHFAYCRVFSNKFDPSVVFPGNTDIYLPIICYVKSIELRDLYSFRLTYRDVYVLYFDSIVRTVELMVIQIIRL